MTGNIKSGVFGETHEADVEAFKVAIESPSGSGGCCRRKQPSSTRCKICKYTFCFFLIAAVGFYSARAVQLFQLSGASPSFALIASNDLCDPDGIGTYPIKKLLLTRSFW